GVRNDDDDDDDGVFKTGDQEKDRMGERVAQLQQLVSPFGKVLCTPYLRKAVTGKMEVSSLSLSLFNIILGYSSMNHVERFK
ncbi:hypothetical protein GW17_00018159, partial [Ensete ventricosum]